MTSIVYPGTFDPITYGHQMLIKRATQMFDQVIIAVAQQTVKQPLLDLETRVELVRQDCAEMPSVEVHPMKGLLVTFMAQHNIRLILRSARTGSDFEYEQRLSKIHQTLDAQVETLLLMPDERALLLSSSFVKEVAALGGALDAFVSPTVAQKLRSTFKKT